MAGRDFTMSLISIGFNSVKTQFFMRLTSSLKPIFGVYCSKVSLDCTGTWFSETIAFNNATFFGTANFTAAQFVSVATFRDVKYIPNTLFHAVKAKLSRKQHRPTEFYLDSRHIDEVASPFFKRYVADQQFIREFNQANPILAQLWRWSSDYGRSLTLWAFWSLFFAFLFALAYMPLPDVGARLDARLVPPLSSNDGCLQRRATNVLELFLFQHRDLHNAWFRRCRRRQCRSAFSRYTGSHLWVYDVRWINQHLLKQTGESELIHRRKGFSMPTRILQTFFVVIFIVFASTTYITAHDFAPSSTADYFDYITLFSQGTYHAFYGDADSGVYLTCPERESIPP